MFDSRLPPSHWTNQCVKSEAYGAYSHYPHWPRMNLLSCLYRRGHRAGAYGKQPYIGKYLTRTPRYVKPSSASSTDHVFGDSVVDSTRSLETSLAIFLLVFFPNRSSPAFAIRTLIRQSLDRRTEDAR